MKIGIYGDSFTCCTEPELADTRWPARLQQWGYDVTVHGAPGTNLHWSKTQFDLTNKNYDRVILIVTSPGRLWFGNNMNKNYKPSIHTVSLKDPFVPPFIKDGSDLCTGIQNVRPGEYDLDMQETLTKYFTYLQCDYVDLTFHNLLLSSINHSRPDILLVPTVNNSLYTELGPNDIWLGSISVLDVLNNKYIKKYLDYRYGEDRDNRPCHMNVENNWRFAKIIQKWIDKNDYHLFTESNAWYSAKLPDDLWKLHPKDRPLS